MDNLAYLYLADAHENSTSSELVSLRVLLLKAPTPDWKSFSGGAWKHLLPLVVAVSILSSISSAFALQRGDQGPSVASLQGKLQQAGFYREQITQVYDFSTEEAVRRFQAAHGLVVNGIVGVETRQKLEQLLTQPVSQPASTASAPSVVVPSINSNNAEVLPGLTSAGTAVDKGGTSTPQTPTVTSGKTSTQRAHPQLLQRGDQGEDVRVLQEKLRVAGFYSGRATGVFGPVTEEAVKQFQIASQLDADGIVGPATLGKLPPMGVGGGVANPPRQTAANSDNLTMGHRGEAVIVLQQHLIAAGYLNGTPTGYFGPMTVDAVRRFQADNYLAVSGIAGPTTRAKLYSLTNTGTGGNFSVLEIQRRLQEQGFYRGQLDGIMGDETQRAIQQAQKFYGISLADITSRHF